MDKFIPVSDRLLVDPMPEEEKNFNGIIIPVSQKEDIEKGIVVAVGDGELHSEASIDMSKIQPGDTILYPKHMGVEVVLDDKMFLVFHRNDIIGVIK